MKIYKGTVLEHHFEESQNGTPLINFKFTLAAEEGERTVFVHVYMSEKSAGMARRALKILGFNMNNPDALAEWNKVNADQMYFAGRACDVEQIDEPYQGKMMTKYQILLGATALPPSKVASLFGILQGAEKPENAPVRTTPAPRPATGPKMPAQTTPTPTQQQSII